MSALAERLRSSLFFVPMVAVFFATGFGFASLAIDRNIEKVVADLPIGFASTVESARTLLGVIAGATISFAGIAFSVSLLIIQLASSQYSPRVVHTLFRDPFNKRVMALVVGTFTYCVVVLRSVRSSFEPGGKPVIPNLSVTLAVVLGIATILAIVAFINHSAHSMDVSEILQRIRREATEQIRSEWTPADPADDRSFRPRPGAADSTTMIRHDRSGWVQQIDVDAMLGCVPEGTILTVETYAGRFAIEGTRFCTLSPAIGEQDRDDVGRRLLASVSIGHTRTMLQDVSYGLRQLVDVGVKALSPGINDPTTAQDAIFHTGAVLAELLRHDPPHLLRTKGTRTVVMVEQPTHEELVRLAYDETRRAGAGQPAVCEYLLVSIASLVESLEAASLSDRTVELRRQARLIIDGCGVSELLDDDIEVVRQSYRDKFST
ncbi:MAG TPA: DUF2254 domain-containing protein [Ilumatobacteraceae bacterium]|nr:DUF2254 domain-containing protein [Ilumatobacteraceae bacterium]HRB01799.1 DUF2254 domain-containing protein [Ilumatobacteraceae bacterium]